MDKILNVLSTISCIVMVVLLYIFNIFVNSIYFNGYIVLIFICMLLNPIANLCRINKKIIKNPIYHLIVILVSSYTSYLTINGLIIYKNNINGIDNYNGINLAGNYFGDKFLYILILVFFLVILAFLFKKEKVKSNKDNSTIMILVILITSIIPFFTHMVTMEMVWTLSEILFLIVVFFKTRGINTASEFQKYYLIIILLSALSINPIALVLSIYLFIQLDTFGLHI